MQETKLALNFVATQDELPDFVIYRKPALPNEKSPADDVQRYSLWVSDEVETDSERKRADFWVSLLRRPGYESAFAVAAENAGLTNWVLATALATKASALFPPSSIRSFGRFLREIAIATKHHSEGDEEIILQPYFLRNARRFGLLVDFHFRPRKEEPFSRKILQLSLSLDSQNRRNANFYVDKKAKITSFLKEHFSRLFPLVFGEEQKPVAFQRNFFPLSSSLLPRKRYIVGHGDERPGPFAGVRDSGPWEGIETCPPLLFIFREQEREAARYLVRALKGTVSALNFDGFDKMFRASLNVSGDPIVISDFSRGEMERAAEAAHKLKPVLPLLVLPHDENEEAYTIHKALFTSRGIPTQVCTTHTIADNYTLKWSVANLALQLFSKAGGKPWKVKSTADKCLIIGIGQAHRYDKTQSPKTIQKFFAFSILTDSSGIFQSIEMLGDSGSETHYLEQLRKNLAALLSTQAKNYTKVVLHTPFKLKQTEMRVLEEEVKNAAGGASLCKFAVVKVNQHNRFFAFNEGVNSLIPYEGTYTRLSRDEVLIWFEGLFPDKPTASKAVPGPTHLKFLHVSDPQLIGDETILRDLLNLSGANWRGFNAKSIPVSVLYCRLVAGMVSSFQELGLPMPAIHNLNPWFL